jgi:hypothetical protein
VVFSHVVDIQRSCGVLVHNITVKLENSQLFSTSTSMDEPGLLLGFLVGVHVPEDLELDGLSQNNDGADILLLRDFFLKRAMFWGLAAVT